MALNDEEPESSADEPHTSEVSPDSEDELAQVQKPNSKSRSKRQTRATATEDNDNRMEKERAPHKPGEIQVVVAAPSRPWDYTKIATSNTVYKVLKDLKRPGEEVWYQIQFEDGRNEEISLKDVMKLRNGSNAIDFYNDEDHTDEEQDASRSSKMKHSLRGRSNDQSTLLSQATKRTRGSYSRTQGESVSGTDDEDSAAKRQRTTRLGGLRSRSRLNSTAPSDDDSSVEEAAASSGRGSRSIRGVGSLRSNDQRRSTRSSGDKIPNYNELIAKDSDDGDNRRIARKGSSSSDDEIAHRDLKLKRSSRNGGPALRERGIGKGIHLSKRAVGRRDSVSSSSSDEAFGPTRRSGRATKTNVNMRERLEDEEIFAEDLVTNTDPKVISVREVFQSLPAESQFRKVHNPQCDVCDGKGASSNKGPSPLIHCQGCSTSIHKVCLGYRSGREHMVTKVGNEDFVMQCRRCIGIATRKDPTAPRLDICQSCKEPGDACAAFSQKKTAKQEQKLRDENDGKDPITPVASNLLNNPVAVLFRCTGCRRGFHFEHLPALDSQDGAAPAVSSSEARFEEYSQDWQCRECTEMPAKPQVLVAWRPASTESYSTDHTYDMVREDEKEYLIKWQNLSYFRCTWMPGAWVWGITTTAMRNAFSRREDGSSSLPKMSKEEAIPEEFLRMEIVLDIRYSSRAKTHAKIHTEESDRARVSDVKEVFVKFQGLGYDEVVWESPPSPDENERWEDFVAAYDEYVAGQHFQQPPPKLKERIKEYRKMNFEKKILMKQQPSNLTGGKVMEYQLEGLNWLLYNYHQEHNVILADEMGLGKTIQVIAALAALVDKPKCWPFLVVVPNSTCPNWRREIKQWAPSLRVVAYYGAREARDMAMDYELYPDGCSDLRAHIVVTSFDAPVDDHSRHFFKKIKWAGLIVDEGQRLKNDKNLLYGALSALKVPFRVLLTGTPLQNNKRELFNLIQFIDNTQDAAELDEKYEELTDENLPELHELIRPYFLRRTKVQVLKFLPPMAQVIIPVTMSVVQKKLYKSILSKSPELIRSIMIKQQAQLNPKDRGSLNNMLMQLRKCLCHPFVYSEGIEERNADPKVMHRNLVDAASKLQLLEIMLPKLHERGHRVLIFSQFLKQLDIIEDFLEGLSLQYQRLDGNIGTLEKQKRIDAFNASDSPLFAFLLSTRAGGVGINLATADTVIIMDPDFNPHQDIQALSRAHRIGQKNKVLVFQFMTKDSAEEKIVQIGRKKMALDHALIESMDADDDAGVDLQSILKHGAQALFNDDDQNDIKYDSASVDKLLDRTQVENTKVGDEKSAESQFSFARIWANDAGGLVDDLGDGDSDDAPASPTLWDKILKEREAEAAREAAAQNKMLGRGKRMRHTVDYRNANYGVHDDAGNIEKLRALTARELASDDSEFDRVEEESADDESEHGSGTAKPLEPDEGNRRQRSQSAKISPAQKKQGDQPRRIKTARSVPQQPATRGHGQDVNSYGNHNGHVLTSYAGDEPGQHSNLLGHHGAIPHHHGPGQYSNTSYHNEHESPMLPGCYTCGPGRHSKQSCPVRRLKLLGGDPCLGCGVAHLKISQYCPHRSPELRLRLMYDKLKKSTESEEFIEAAREYLRGSIGAVVRRNIMLRRARENHTDGPFPGNSYPAPSALDTAQLAPPSISQIPKSSPSFPTPQYSQGPTSSYLPSQPLPSMRMYPPHSAPPPNPQPSMIITPSASRSNSLVPQAIMSMPRPQVLPNSRRSSNGDNANKSS